MGVRAKRGDWPDGEGDYEIVDTDGCHLFYVLGGSFGPDTEAVAERILVAINGDTVPAPTLPESPEDLGGLVTRLWQWKAEATEVIAGWERVWDAMGRPGQLGKSKSDGCLEALAAAPTLPDDLPSWVSMHATATGADLIEHDPNGEEWERSLNGVNWSGHVADAVRGCTYLVRRRPVPVEPTTEKVPWWEALRDGRKIHANRKAWLACTAMRTVDGDVWVGSNGNGWDTPDPDGMVTVLREDGAS